MCDIGYVFCRRTEDTGRVGHIRSPATTDARKMDDAVEINTEVHTYEHLHHQERSTCLYENQAAVAGAAGVTASMEDVEYMEIV